MNEKMYEIIKNKEGFIAALDQSGGSSSKTLKAYGIPESAYSTEEEMFDLIHEMRTRVMTSKSFTNEKVGNVSYGNVPHLVVNAYIVAILGLFIKKLTT